MELSRKVCMVVKGQQSSSSAAFAPFPVFKRFCVSSSPLSCLFSSSFTFLTFFFSLSGSSVHMKYDEKERFLVQNDSSLFPKVLETKSFP